uniref:Elongation of very long chain fatty acids protein n=1 Tax=Acrobeloides nanus TaxID=290746 RepID=A0A914E8A3_9BILA
MHCRLNQQLITLLCYIARKLIAVGDWVFLFGLSKIVELGDTVFLVLKKRPVTFLHVYHHCTVLVYTWSTGSKRAAIGRWFVILNMMAHSAMYTYYAFMSAGIKVPRKIARCVTIVQITQFVIGLFILFTVCAIKATTDWNCYNEWTTLFFGIFIYFSYFVLFGNFFIETYHKKFTQKYNKQN